MIHPAPMAHVLRVSCLCDVQLLKAEEDAPMAADQEAGGGGGDGGAAGGDAGGAAEGGEGPAPMET